MLPPVCAKAEDTGMKRRIFATFIWFYVGWYGGAILAEYLGVSPLLGPIIGTAAAALFAGDPRRIIWSDLGIQRARAMERLTATSANN
jgi:hypothetical protein